MSYHWTERTEPSLGEMLSDPIVRMVMARDRLAEDEVRAELRASAARLRAALADRTAGVTP